jgi:hypothetical protein
MFAVGDPFLCAMPTPVQEQVERQASRKNAREVAPGILASLALHFLVALSVVLLMMRTTAPLSRSQQIVPVDVVIRLAEQTRSPPSATSAPVPQASPRGVRNDAQSSPHPLERTAPEKTRPLPLDNLDAKLRAFARLRQPEKSLPALDAETGTQYAGPTGATGEATYSVRDYVRAQAERRWNLDFTKLGNRRFEIAIHVLMQPDGTIVTAELVDKQRAASDAIYRMIALSARNAVLLSSPISLPTGRYDEPVDMTLVFNPRDMKR